MALEDFVGLAGLHEFHVFLHVGHIFGGHFGHAGGHFVGGILREDMVGGGDAEDGGGEGEEGFFGGHGLNPLGQGEGIIGDSKSGDDFTINE